MGATSKASAVDPRGESWEVQGLYVAGSPLFPSALPPGVDPVATSAALALRVAGNVAEALTGTRPSAAAAAHGGPKRAW
jgi:long-chain-alcohol oxidase